jgi:hypothetical protein
MVGGQRCSLEKMTRAVEGENPNSDYSPQVGGGRSRQRFLLPVSCGGETARGARARGFSWWQ